MIGTAACYYVYCYLSTINDLPADIFYCRSRSSPLEITFPNQLIKFLTDRDVSTWESHQIAACVSEQKGKLLGLFLLLQHNFTLASSFPFLSFENEERELENGLTVRCQTHERKTYATCASDSIFQQNVLKRTTEPCHL